MTRSMLEQRVAALEKRVAELETENRAAKRSKTDETTPGARPRTWRDTVGMFTGNEGLLEIFRAAMELREKDRERARKRYSRKRAKA